MFDQISKDAPRVNPAQIAALYAMSKGAPNFQVIAGRPHEVVVQAEDGRAWVLSAIGPAHKCDGLASPYRDKPCARHPLADLGCPEDGCDIRVPMLADGALLGSAVAEFLTSHGGDAKTFAGLTASEDALTCPIHGTELQDVPRLPAG